MRGKLSTPEDFWARVDRGSGCWLWQGAKDTNGYGRLGFGKKMWGAHRLAFWLTNPDWDRKLHVLHRCDTPACVRPDHLFLGTQVENIADMIRKKRSARGGVRPVGEKHGLSKLTEANVLEIRASSEPYQVLAARFGIKPQVISQIRLRKTWRHL